MKLLTAAEMREVDRRTIDEIGIPVWALMENAGRAIADSVVARRSKLHVSTARVLVVCGRGNNGGDGLVAARHLANRGYTVEVTLLGEIARLKSDVVRGNATALRQWGIALHEVTSLEQLERVCGTASFDVVVDAIFGTGFVPPAGDFESAAIGRIDHMRGRGAYVVAVDLPSGLDADRGRVVGRVVTADVTVTFAAAKPAHYLTPATSNCGEVVVADICIPHHLIDVADHRFELVDRRTVARLLPRRPVDGHKGTFGHLLVVAGSRGKTGAAVLTARAALRAGVGLVTVATPASCLPTVANGLPELMTEPVAESMTGRMTLDALPRLCELANTRDAVAIGPGLGDDEQTVQLVRRLVTQLSCPIVLDADALNAFAATTGEFASGAAIVITPHPGEAARLRAQTTRAVQDDRLETALALARERRCVTVLKGSHSIIADPDGRAAINPTGNSGMATAGTGDVLTGVVGAMLAQGLTPTHAAIVSVYVHGLAGDRAAATVGEASLIASDLIDALPHALGQLTSDLP